MSVEEDLISSHSINSIVSPDGQPNLKKIFRSMEKRKSLRIEEKDLGLKIEDNFREDKSFGLSTTE